MVPDGFTVVNGMLVGNGGVQQSARPQTRPPQGQNVIPRAFSQIPDIGNSDASRTRIEEAMMSRARNQLDPVFQDQQRSLEQQLANRGLAPGTAAYDRELTRFMSSRNNAYEQAQQNAVMAGSQEAQRLFQNQFGYDQLMSAENIANLQMQAAQGNQAAQLQLAQMQMEMQNSQFGQNFDAQQQQQAFENQMRMLGYQDSRDMQQRQQYFNEMGFFGQGMGFPIIGEPGIGGVDVGGAFGQFQNGQANQYNAAYGNYQQEVQANQQQNMQYAALLAMMFSDKRMKDEQGPANPDDALDAINKLPFVKWNYKGESVPHVGTYSQDFHQALGLPFSPAISFIDLAGAVIGSLQAISNRLDKLEART